MGAGVGLACWGALVCSGKLGLGSLKRESSQSHMTGHLLWEPEECNSRQGSPWTRWWLASSVRSSWVRGLSLLREKGWIVSPKQETAKLSCRGSSGAVTGSRASRATLHTGSAGRVLHTQRAMSLHRVSRRRWGLSQRKKHLGCRAGWWLVSSWSPGKAGMWLCAQFLLDSKPGLLMFLMASKCQHLSGAFSDFLGKISLPCYPQHRGAWFYYRNYFLLDRSYSRQECFSFI